MSASPSPTPLPVWLRAADDGVTLTLHVQPGASRTEAVGLHGDALKIRLAAPPVDGRANECLLAWLAAQLGVAKSAASLRAGASARRKVVAIAGVSAAQVLACGFA